MNSGILFVIDLDRCWGCRTCEVACGVEKSIPPVKSGITVNSIESEGEIHPERVYIPVTCRHCDPAPCIEICPESALVRNNEGLVVVDSDICIGCGLCIRECPYGAVTVDKNISKAVKCDMCISRRETGGNPNCVHHCIGGALSIIEESELKELSGLTNIHREGRLVYISRLNTFGNS